MAYYSSTESSSLANPPVRIGGGIGGPRPAGSTAVGGQSVWLYSSTNLTTDMTAANFFTDGWYMGMKNGDIVIGTQTNGSTVGSSEVSYQGVITGISTSGCALSTGGTMTSTFA